MPCINRRKALQGSCYLLGPSEHLSRSMMHSNTYWYLYQLIMLKRSQILPVPESIGLQGKRGRMLFLHWYG